MFWHRVSIEHRTQERLPVVDGAFIVVVIAWHISLKRARAHSPKQAICCDDNLAPIILGALAVVVACSTEGGNAYADTEISVFRLHCSAEAWALVAFPEVEVAIFAASNAGLAWLWNAT
jgi:hypothetical protein